MKFEWDQAKDARNRSKHGIDFDTAKSLWNDEERIEIHAPHPIEDRWIIKLWTTIYTMRGKAIRIISVRHSREKEATLYESPDKS